MALRAVHEIFEEIRHVDVSDRAVRATMSVFLAIGLLVSVWWTWATHSWLSPVPWIPAVSCGILWGLSRVRAAFVRPIHRIWMAIALVLGYIMTRVILLAVFFVLVTPIGVVVRLLDRDPLDRSQDKSADSWWIRRTPPDRPADERMKRLF